MQEPGLIGHWACGPGVGTLWPDRSGSGNNGTLSGPTWALGGPFSNRPAIQLAAGSDLINCGLAASINDTIRSASAWVRTTAFTDEQQVVAKVKLVTGVGWVFVIATTGVLEYFQFATVTNTHYVSNETVPINTWTHVAYAGGSLYINGVLCTLSLNTAGVGVTLDVTANLTIGSREGDTAGLNGIIDDVRVYNFVLTAAQVAKIADPRYFQCTEYAPRGGSSRPAPFAPIALR